MTYLFLGHKMLYHLAMVISFAAAINPGSGEELTAVSVVRRADIVSPPIIKEPHKPQYRPVNGNDKLIEPKSLKESSANTSNGLYQEPQPTPNGLIMKNNTTYVVVNGSKKKKLPSKKNGGNEPPEKIPVTTQSTAVGKNGGANHKNGFPPVIKKPTNPNVKARSANGGGKNKTDVGASGAKSPVSPIVMNKIPKERSLRAVRNYDARLPCGQGKIFLDGPDAYVLWVKDDEQFLYRFPNEETLAKSLNPNNIYGTSCDDNDHCYDDTSLFLPRVGDKDAGKYRCRVHYQGSSSVDYVIDLRIVETTGTPRLFDEKDEKIVTPYVGPLTLGSNLTITCEVVISEAPTTVQWLRNGVTVRRIVSDKPGILRERVEIVNATRSELDAHYQCMASNADVTDAMTASFVVKMYLPPIKVEIRLNNNLNFEVGQPRVVDCVVVGCVPTPTINWYLAGTLLKASAHKELHDGNYTVSSLTLIASKHDNKKWLSCRVHNPYLPTIYEDNVTLHVSHYQLCHFSEIQNIRIVTGDLEEITCTMTSSTQPSKFKWTFSNSKVIFTKPVAIKQNIYTSNLTWVPSASDLGNLKCQMVNDHVELGTSCSFSLVYDEARLPPDCVLQETQIICKPDPTPVDIPKTLLVVSIPVGVLILILWAAYYKCKCIQRKRRLRRQESLGLSRRLTPFELANYRAFRIRNRYEDPPDEDEQSSDATAEATDEPNVIRTTEF